MNWSVRKFEQKCIIEVPADIFNDEITETFKNLLKELSEDGYKSFYLDMCQISKVNSKSLASIINIYQFASCYDLEVKLYNIQPYVSQLIYQTRLNQIFDICDPEEDFFYAKETSNSYKTA